ncbi:MAG: thioesterase family protein [Nocardioides sp.]|nr:thioesterase family protein [Nocardioides sp.]
MVATTEFDRDIQVAGSGGATYTADLAAGWVVGGGLNGGYVLAVVANAVRQHLPRHPDPISVSAYYASASTPGPAEVRVDVKRDRGTLAIATAELWQDDELRVTTTGTYADLAALHEKSADAERVTATEPQIPPREECVLTSTAPERMRRSMPMLERFECYVPPAEAMWKGASGMDTLSAWIRHPGREPDVLTLLQVVDALPPVPYALGMPGWAPTLELTCHVRHHPAPGWLKVTHTSRNISGGMFEEDCEVWDSAGRLVAQSRQLARLPRPVTG